MMRLLIVAILILVVGGILSAAYLVHPSALPPAELQQAKSTCSECHRIPVIQSAISIHAAHPDVDCSVCHTGGNTSRTNFNSCIPCHSVPAYTSVTALHDAHSTMECVECHSNAPGLATANNAHIFLKWAGLGLTSLGVLGIIMNYAISKVRFKHH